MLIFPLGYNRQNWARRSHSSRPRKRARLLVPCCPSMDGFEETPPFVDSYYRERVRALFLPLNRPRLHPYRLCRHFCRSVRPTSHDSIPSSGDIQVFTSGILITDELSLARAYA